MTDTATAALKVKKALKAGADSIFDSNVVLVAHGFPTARRDLSQIVAFLDLEVEQTPGPMSSTNRSRDENVTVSAVISVSLAEGDDDEAVEDIAWGLLRQLENYARQTDTTLGGACMWCFLSSARSFGYTNAEQLARGRLCEIEATFTARVRITG